MLLSSNLFYVTKIKEKTRAKFFKDIREGDELLVQHSFTGEYIIKNLTQKTERQLGVKSLEKRFAQLEVEEIDYPGAVASIVKGLSYLSSLVAKHGAVDMDISYSGKKYPICVTPSTVLALDVGSREVFFANHVIPIVEIQGIHIEDHIFTVPRSDYSVQEQ